MSDLLALGVLLPAVAVWINESSRQVRAQVIFFGPGPGPSENLQHLQKELPDSKPLSRLDSPPAELEAVDPWWFLPVPLGSVRGFQIELHLYAPPLGRADDPTLDFILKTVDGIVFVAEASPFGARATASVPHSGVAARPPPSESHSGRRTRR